MHFLKNGIFLANNSDQTSISKVAYSLFCCVMLHFEVYASWSCLGAFALLEKVKLFLGGKQLLEVQPGAKYILGKKAGNKIRSLHFKNWRKVSMRSKTWMKAFIMRFSPKNLFLGQILKEGGTPTLVVGVKVLNLLIRYNNYANCKTQVGELGEQLNVLRASYRQLAGLPEAPAKVGLLLL